MNLIVETIKRKGSNFVITQGHYDLTVDAMDLRDQRPLHAGDDYAFEFTYVDESENAIDISGADIRMTIKFDVGDNDGSSILQKTATITSAPDGQFKIEIARDDVPGPQRILAYYDIQMTISSKNERILHGDIEFLPNITQVNP